MPGRSRVRDRFMWASGGIKELTGGTYVIAPDSGISDNENCTDSTQPPPFVNDQALNVTRKWSEPLTIYGESTMRSRGPVQFIGFVPPNRAEYAYCEEPTAINSGYWITKAIGNMDPYKPHVDVPLFIFELKDFPGMLRDLGKVLKGDLRPSDVPGGYLAHQFGWAPLVDDVKKLFDLSKATDDRIRYFRKLESGRRVKRTLFAGQVRHFVEKDAYKVIANVPTLAKWAYTADITTEETQRIWYTANAKLTASLPTSQQSLRQLSRRAALGLTARPDLIWNALPWSWLVDYFGNVGDYVEAQQGLTRFKCTRMCLMATSVVTSSLTNPRLAPGLSATASLLHTVRKQRFVSSNPTPRITSTPFLSGKQQSILGALATASALRGLKR